jgi:SAM-dependent methyltransferase
MTACRVCGGDLEAPVYEAPAPALTSIMTLLDVPTRVFVCDGCGHAQCDDIPDIQAFYDSTYRISLASDEHDQVFAVEPDGTVIFRTDHQAQIALRLLKLPPGARMLDYGAAKADTLRKMVAARPDLQPHVFDVSADYAGAWDGWVPKDAQAIYTAPAAWEGRFDAAMSHFVLEHVPDPVGFIRALAALLKPDGLLLLSLPDVAANPGDMTVADHLNHFSEASLAYALAAGGFRLRTIDRTSFPGAFFAVAERGSDAPSAFTPPASEAAQRARDICRSWEKAAVNLDTEAERFRGRKAAIYGAGFYGSWIYSRVGRAVDLAAVLDRNPHLQGTIQSGVRVMPPEQIPGDVEVLFIGLNPLKAREAIAAQPWLHRPGLHHVWL